MKHPNLWTTGGWLIALLLAAATMAAGQNMGDTTRTVAADSVAVPDSLRSTFLAGLGTIRAEVDSTEWSSSKFIWTDARYIGDLIRLTPGIILRDLGEPGHPPELTRDGVGGRGQSFLLDGLAINDPVTGTVNLYDIPLEFIDHIETWTGAESFFAGSNGSASTMNIVTRQYNTGKPITKIRFSQGPYEHLLTDALFSQNVIRSLNLTFGVQRQVSDGHFINSAYDSWNVRTRLRYNVSEKLNVAVMYLYYKDIAGMNSGINIDSTRSLGLDPFNEAEAITFNKTANETRSRSDVICSLIAALFPDSSWSTKASLSSSTADRAYDDPTGITSGIFDRYSWRSTGGTIRQTLRIGPLNIVGGGQFETRHVDFQKFAASVSKSYLAWFGNAEADILGIVKPEVSVRGESYDHATAFSGGASLSVRPLPFITLSGGYSSTYRFPTIQESNWISYQFDPASGLNLLEHHKLAAATATLTLDRWLRASVTASQRTIDNALLFKSSSPSTPFAPPLLEVVPTLTIRQISGAARMTFWDFEALGGLSMTETKQQGRIDMVQPKFVLSGELSYRAKLLRGALETKVGIQSRYLSSHQGERFLASYAVFEKQDGPPIPAFSTLGLFGVFNIGDAFLTITWENVLDAPFYSVYPYPELRRNISVGINWIFLD